MEVDNELDWNEELRSVKRAAISVHKRLPQSVLLDDVVQAGALGMVKAWKKFDKSKGIKFRTFSKYRIHGEIIEYLRSLDWGSRSIRRESREIEVAAKYLEGKLGRTATDQELADELKIPLVKLQSTMTKLDGLRVEQIPLENIEDGELESDVIENIPDPTNEDSYTHYLRSERLTKVDKAMKYLKPQERKVLSLYYFGEIPMIKIGEALGVSESRVCKIHKTAITTLRNHVVPNES